MDRIVYESPMVEVFRPVVVGGIPYEGYYVGTHGSVMSIRHASGDSWRYLHRLRPANTVSDGSGYEMVNLFRDGVAKMCLVHRLVAEAWIPNPNGWCEVNHLDEVKVNNEVNNLEWCTRLYNARYGTCRDRIARAHCMRVGQYDRNGVLVHEWCSGKDAGEALGIKRQAICMCLKGKQKTAGGFVWRYL